MVSLCFSHVMPPFLDHLLAIPHSHNAYPCMTYLCYMRILVVCSVMVFWLTIDGDCVHIYYPQSLAAKAEALELFSVEKQLISSHSDTINLQLDNDSRVAMKLMSFGTMSSKEFANQLVMFIPLNPATFINLETSTHIGRSLSLVYRLFSFTSSPLKSRDEISLRGWDCNIPDFKILSKKY